MANLSFFQGFFLPSIFDHNEKLQGRRKLVERSYDLYDGSPNDPISNAQLSIFQALGSSAGGNVDSSAAASSGEIANGTIATAALTHQETEVQAVRSSDDTETTPHSSVPGSPAPEAGNSPHNSAQAGNQAPGPAATIDPMAEKISLAEEQDRLLPIMPLDTAILTSISHGSQSDERKTRDFMGGIMVVGGGAQIPGFHAFLEERLKELKPAFAKDIMIGVPPRELDPQVVIWKGGSVFGKLRGTNDSWISRLEYDRLGSRLLPYKCMWVW